MAVEQLGIGADDSVAVLRAGSSEVSVAPARGGSILAWVHDGQPMFVDRRASIDAPFDPLVTASFPLVPYSNRIADARFSHADAEHRLRANFPPEPHAIHGVGWRARWDVTVFDAHSITLELRHAADADWPWPFLARQRIAITPRRLTMELCAQNLASETAPLGLAPHPYFDSAGASLRFGANKVWQRGPDLLPAYADRPAGQFDFANGAPVAERDLDHYYGGWDGEAKIEWAGLASGLRIRATRSLPGLVVYIPKDGGFFCVEPVPHMIDALNRPDADEPMPLIAPDQWFEARVDFDLVG